MEKNCIVSTPHVNENTQLMTLTWNDVCALNFSFNQPFCLRLITNEVFLCKHVLRLVPKKRLVVTGIWQGKEVVAKLFFDAKQAKRHLEKDIAGICALQKNKVPTPEILYQTESIDHKIKILMLERIMDAKNLQEIWQDRNDLNHEELMTTFKSVIIEIATQHVLGLLQHDLHFKNFLINEKVIYTLDGGQIETFPYLLSKSISMNNLALFLSQLGAYSQDYQEILFKHYAHARGWKLKPEDFSELTSLIKKWNDARGKHFEKKIYRNSTQFSYKKNWRRLIVVDRQYAGDELLHFLSNPELVFNQLSGRLLKSGNSATVLKVQFDGLSYVIKRYNLKSIWHSLRRCLRISRASNCWRIAHKLDLFGVLTAKPIALLENKFFGLNGKSYYITEYVSEENAYDYFNQHFAQTEKTTTMVKRIVDLLKGLMRVEITQGDLKITNILINNKTQPVIIDLDGACEHFSLSGLRRAWKKELKRFLKNFDSNLALRNQFETELKYWTKK